MNDNLEQKDTQDFEVHRLTIRPGDWFTLPRNVTFNWQESRQEFSVWFPAGAPEECAYIVIGTGHTVAGDFEIVQTVVLPDGFHAFHLLRKIVKGAQ